MRHISEHRVRWYLIAVWRRGASGQKVLNAHLYYPVGNGRVNVNANPGERAKLPPFESNFNIALTVVSTLDRDWAIADKTYYRTILQRLEDNLK